MNVILHISIQTFIAYSVTLMDWLNDEFRWKYNFIFIFLNFGFLLYSFDLVGVWMVKCLWNFIEEVQIDWNIWNVWQTCIWRSSACYAIFEWKLLSLVIFFLNNFPSFFTFFPFLYKSTRYKWNHIQVIDVMQSVKFSSSFQFNHWFHWIP